MTVNIDDVLPVALQTPFRAQLIRLGLRAVMTSGRKMTTHLVKGMRPLCGIQRPKGKLSDITIYADRGVTCERCIRSFDKLVPPPALPVTRTEE